MAANPPIDELIKLMVKAKAGDKQAFSRLYTAFYTPVFRYCNKRLKNLADAEDVTEQVFLRLYGSRTPFVAQNTSPLNYLYTIARHCLSDFWQKQKRTPLNLPEDFDAPDSHSASEDALSQITADQLLNMVSAEEKQILILRLVEGFSSSEVALKVNKSEAAVRQIQCRALKKIKASL